MRRCLLFVAVLGLSLPARAAEPQFSEKVLDPNVGNVCYAVAAADVDGDNKTDVVAVTENRVVWFQNPDWNLRVIIADQTERDNVCIAAHDIDGDGQIDFALGAGWTKIGTLQWLCRGKTLDDKWTVHLIGQEGWTHRMRWGDLLGTGKPQLVVSPLNKTVAPNGVRLTVLEVPADPKTSKWAPTVIDESLNAMHNHWMGDLNGDSRTDLLTASREGLFLFQRSADGAIGKTQVAKGAESLPMAKENSLGNGEVKVGRLRSGKKFVAAIAPMHGNLAVVYTEPAATGQFWEPHVLTGDLNRGHAVGVGDLDKDGTDEVVIGHSDATANPGPGISVFKTRDDQGGSWERQVIDDGGIAIEDLVVEDFTGDGWPDIAAGGRATHNVKLYVNRGQ